MSQKDNAKTLTSKKVLYSAGQTPPRGVLIFSTLFNELAGRSFIALPIYTDLSISFDVKMIIPFLIITVAAIVDNIGDFTATQNANDPDMKKSIGFPLNEVSAAVPLQRHCLP